MLFSFLFIFLLPISSPYKILIFAPTISRSHMISNGRIADTLALAGHNVTLFEPDFSHLEGTVNTSKVAKRWPLGGFSTILIDWIRDHNNDIFEESSAVTLNKAYLQYSLGYNQLCKELINREDVMAKLKSEKFDGFFSEQLGQQLVCGNGIGHALGIKSHFWISSLPISEDIAWTIGLPNPTSYVPASYDFDAGSKMSYMERMYNMWYAVNLMITARMANSDINKIFREKYGSNFPALEEIASNSDLMFVSSEEFIDFPRPTLPNIIHIGGLGIENENLSLPEPFASEMQKGRDGVVFFSLGTNVDTSQMPKSVMQNVINTAAKFPNIHFIIKICKSDEWSRTLAKGVPNVFLSTWVPQPAILAHSRLRLFITHGGYNGLMEAARSAVPLIVIPFMFDQTRNSRAIAERGFGIALKRQLLRDDPAHLESAVRKVLEDKKYKEKARRISNLVLKKPFNARERLVQYTEFVLENNGLKELLVEGRNINIFIYFNLDIILPFIVVILFVVYVTLKVLLSVVSWVSLVSKVKVE